MAKFLYNIILFCCYRCQCLILCSSYFSGCMRHFLPAIRSACYLEVRRRDRCHCHRRQIHSRHIHQSNPKGVQGTQTSRRHRPEGRPSAHHWRLVVAWSFGPWPKVGRWWNGLIGFCVEWSVVRWILVAHFRWLFCVVCSLIANLDDELAGISLSKRMKIIQRPDWK